MDTYDVALPLPSGRRKSVCFAVRGLPCRRTEVAGGSVGSGAGHRGLGAMGMDLGMRPECGAGDSEYSEKGVSIPFREGGHVLKACGRAGGADGGQGMCASLEAEGAGADSLKAILEAGS